MDSSHQTTPEPVKDKARGRNIVFWIIIFLFALTAFLVAMRQGQTAAAVVGGAFIAALVALMTRSLVLVAFVPQNSKEEVPILLTMLGLIVVALWISQGVLATQVNVRVKAKASQGPNDKDALVSIALTIDNTGVRQTQIKDATLVVCAEDKCRTWGDVFTLAKNQTEGIRIFDADSLGFGGPYKDEFTSSAGRDYILTWGTQESRQMAVRMPTARFYEVRVSVGTGELGTSSVNKWRASAIVAMQPKWAQKDSQVVDREGESMEQEKSAGETRSTFELLKKFLTGKAE